MFPTWGTLGGAAPPRIAPGTSPLETRATIIITHTRATTRRLRINTLRSDESSCQVHTNLNRKLSGTGENPIIESVSCHTYTGDSLFRRRPSTGKPTKTASQVSSSRRIIDLRSLTHSRLPSFVFSPSSMCQKTYIRACVGACLSPQQYHTSCA